MSKKRRVLSDNQRLICAAEYNRTLLPPLLILMACFVLLELSFFIQGNRAYLFDFIFVSDGLHIPLGVLPGVLFFLAAQALLHAGYCLLVWYVTRPMAVHWRLSSTETLYLGISLWLLGIMTILAANQVYFPNSKFAELTSLFMGGQVFARGLLFFLISVCVLACASAFFCLLRQKCFKQLVGLLLIGLFSGAYVSLKETPPMHLMSSKAQPTIIIIGFDSLRPDYLGYFGRQIQTPVMDAFLNQAAVFNEAVTPLARTFPSWTSILTGKYPKESSIRFNLADQALLPTDLSLPSQLRRRGYKTVFATDETRFSNIDTSFGFDQVITPPVGLNDFLLGTFNDFPMSNLLVNTRVGKWLFPYSYANRPAYITYEPDSFLNLIKQNLSDANARPLFLSVHFCLTHAPYLWAHLPAENLSMAARYAASVERVDKQAGDFLTFLKQAGLLQHAIVVVLSDHGEALGFPGDRITEQDNFMPQTGRSARIPAFYPPSLDKEAINQSAGHGTDVLSLPQYHTLLAFRLYGDSDFKPVEMSGVVSLLDVMPTILTLVGQPVTALSGYSLAANVHGLRLAVPTHTAIFLESDFSPAAIRTVYPEMRKVLLEGVQLFRVDPRTTRLIVKDAMGSKIIHSKQYADISGEWMLALYPQHQPVYTPILVNLASGQWTNDLQSQFAAQSPAQSMLRAIKSFYGTELPVGAGTLK